MTDATVRELRTFPVKGARGQRPDALHVDAIVGVQGDRRFAIKRRIGQPDGWASKVHFRVCMNTPEMAAQTPVFASGAGAPDVALDRAWLRQVADALGESGSGHRRHQGRLQSRRYRSAHLRTDDIVPQSRVRPGARSGDGLRDRPGTVPHERLV